MTYICECNSTSHHLPLYSLKRALYSLKRAIYSLKRASHFLKRALYFLKRALHVRISLSCLLSPKFSQKSHIFSQKSPTFSQKSPIFSQKSPTCTYLFVLPFEPYILVESTQPPPPYGVAMISRLLKIIRLFCKRALYKRLYSTKETHNLIDPSNHRHPIPRPPCTLPTHTLPTHTLPTHTRSWNTRRARGNVELRWNSHERYLCVLRRVLQYVLQ